jgi:glycosyltransferase involved in cell wall biosynthesis
VLCQSRSVQSHEDAALERPWDGQFVRLLYVIPYYLPARDFGGPVSVCAALAQEMVRRGHSVTVLTTDVASRTQRIASHHERAEGVEVIRLRNLSQRLVGQNLFTPLQTKGTLAGLLPQTDVVHIHEFFTWPSFRAATEAKRRQRPVLLSGHASINRSPARGRQNIKAVWFRLLGERTLKASTLLHAATSQEAEACQDAAAFRVRYDTKERPIFLFVGRLANGKGVDLLLEVARRLVNHDSKPLFVLVGPAENRPDLANPGYLTENVLLTGPLCGHELADAYRAASVFVLPSYAEGLPMTALEALCFGLPTLLSRACNLPEVEAASAGIQVDPEIQSVCRGVEEMLAKRSGWPAMSVAARQLAQSRFDPVRVHDRYEALYQELASV